jgi:L-asparaginase
VTTPSIAVMVTGGTIDTVGADRLDLARYAEHGQTLQPEELLSSVPEANRFCSMEAVDCGRLGTVDWAVDDWLALAGRISTAAASGVSGVVVTSGTNYLAELAFCLSLLLPRQIPVAVTGAMRPANAIGADGPLNLLNALRFAATPHFASWGPVVIMNGMVHAPRYVVKTATHAVEAFQSPGAGPLAWITAEGEIRPVHTGIDPKGPSIEFLDLATNSNLPRVDILATYYGSDGALVEAASALGASGIVVAGLGAGRPGPKVETALCNAAYGGMAVVLCAEARIGTVQLTPVQAAAGLISGGGLSPSKARLQLMLCLASKLSRPKIAEIFARA